MFGAWEAGAWQALSRVFQPDLVAGASAGALNGWAIAGGAPPEELVDEWLHPEVGNAMRLRFPLAPWRGVFDPAALETFARKLTEKYTPRVPFGAAAVEVPRLKLRLLRGDGMTWRHLVASCAVPSGFPPVMLDGHYYVDGGLLAALPLWAAAEMGATRIVALDCLPIMPSRALRAAVGIVRRMAPRASVSGIPVLRFVPGETLGRLRDAVFWKKENVERWISLGQHDVELGLCRLSEFIA
jgi:NTE family protein